jgi:hypothetical protein
VLAHVTLVPSCSLSREVMAGKPLAELANRHTKSGTTKAVAHQITFKTDVLRQHATSLSKVAENAIDRLDRGLLWIAYRLDFDRSVKQQTVQTRHDKTDL